MNIEAYIASGVLEQYVLGQLLPEDAAGVEQLAATYPEIRQELNSIEQTFEAYALKHAVAPRPELKEKIRQQLSFAEESKTPEPIIKGVKVRNIGSFEKYLVAASVMLAVVSSGLAVYYFNQWKRTEASLTGLQQQYAQVAQNVETVKYQLKQQRDNNQLFHEVAINPDMKLVAMAGVKENNKACQAHVYWNKGTQEVYLDVQSMPQLPEGKQYQLWALKDGQPIDAGVFNITDEFRLQHMKNIDGAQAFAVTIEPQGGSPAPTLSTLCVMGNI